MKKFIADDKGATAIEYGLIAALVALVGVVAFTALGDTVSKAFTDIADALCFATTNSNLTNGTCA
ncbi:Flp family type IVb pilin [Sneathiella sp.]|uniref:Flp family type IVb pilin n=1 Tax=Sneathiella sp. TaxID=1964365 RepID=UPI003000FE8B